MNIRFTSSLTADDENMLAPALLTALASILDVLPIAYLVRIETSDSQVFQHSGSGGEPGQADEGAGEHGRPASLPSADRRSSFQRRRAADASLPATG